MNHNVFANIFAQKTKVHVCTGNCAVLLVCCCVSVRHRFLN